MGSNYSKSNVEMDAVAQKNDLNKDISANPDPRSPTPEIARTPLQNKNGSKHNITKNVDLRKTFENGKTEEKLINNNPILSAVIKNHLQSYDPRSPTQDFNRTPIVLSSKIEDDFDRNAHRADSDVFGTPRLTCGTKNSNDNSPCDGNQVKPTLPVPKNLCEGFFDMTLNNSLNDSKEPLGSSTASKDGIEKNMSQECNKPAEVLETNFDYVEFKPDQFEDSFEDMSESQNCQILECDIKNIPVYKTILDDPRSPSIGIERTPLTVPAAVEEVNEENVEEMSDDSLLKALQTTNSEIHEKEDGILIYQDESEAVKTTKKSKSTNNSGSRTPLSCMKNKTSSKQGRSKSTNTLYDSKDQNKLHKRVSHIPRLKSLTMQSKTFSSDSSHSLKTIKKTTAVSGDCENTPPHSHRDRWDKDNSIVL